MAPLYVTVGLVVVAGATLAAGALWHDRGLVAVSMVGAGLAGVALAWYRANNSASAQKNSAPQVLAFVREDVQAGAGERSEERGPGGTFPIEDYDRLRAEEIVPLLSELDAVGLTMVKSREESHRRRWFILNQIERLLAPAPVGPVKSPFPIDGYDQMRVVDVLPLLKSLTPDELAVVAHHEQETAGRRTILSRIARIQQNHQRLSTRQPDALES